jgi:hypothetical protein
MPDSAWISVELVLPREGREVLTYSRYTLGIKKGYHRNGEWYDSAHRKIEVDYWKPRLEDSEEDQP